MAPHSRWGQRVSMLFMAVDHHHDQHQRHEPVEGRKHALSEAGFEQAAVAVRGAVHQPSPDSTQATWLDLAPDLSCTNSTQAHCVDVEHQPTDLAVEGLPHQDELSARADALAGYGRPRPPSAHLSTGYRRAAC